MVRLSVPGTLAYRDLVLRVVASSCKLVRRAEHLQDAGHGATDDPTRPDDFELQVVSACSEAFNNIAIHAYGGRGEGAVDVRISTGPCDIEIVFTDTGRSFDPDLLHRATPEPLPESGMGLHIICSFMDAVCYTPGTPPDVPNTLRLKKRRTLR